MGLFGFVKKQLLKVIEWEDDSKDILVYRYPLTDRDEIMTSSTLVVRESQYALFMYKGKIADVFGPGTYKLTTENIPFLTKLQSLPAGFESKIKAEVYYVNSKQFTALKWGTQTPIIIRDAEFDQVHVRSYGSYDFKVSDPAKFIKEISGTNAVFKVADLENRNKSLIIQSITDFIAQSKISAMDLPANLHEISEGVMHSTKNLFEPIGVEITRFACESISLSEELSQAITQKNSLKILERQMGTYTRKKAADAMLESASNPNGNNLAGLGVGLGAGANLGNLFTNTVNNPASYESKILCQNCGAEINAKAKFCPECGQSTQPVKKACPNCGHLCAKNAKFCPECGGKFVPGVRKCSKCGAETKSKAKFCPECGNELK